MNSKVFSVIVRCWWDEPSATTRLQVVRVDTTEEVHLSDSAFLLRFYSSKGKARERCLIRHLATGREASIQGGANLRTLIFSCLIGSSSEREPQAPDIQDS